MPSRSFRHLIILVVLGVVLAACGGDSTSTGPYTGVRSGRVEGTVRLLPDDVALAGVQLVLIEPQSMSVVAGPTASDADGAYTLDGVPRGFYQLVLLGLNYRPYSPGELLLTVSRSDGIHRDLRVMEIGLPAAGELTLSGTIRDAQSRRPIPLAVVGLTGTPGQILSAGLLGSAAVSNEDGHFVLRELGEARTAYREFGETWSFAVTCPGYRPYAFRVPYSTSSGPDLIHLEIDLQRGAGDASVQGRIVQDGKAVAGVPVALGWSDEGELLELPAKAPLPGYTTVTNRDGWYRFEGVTAGSSVHVSPGYLVDDGFVYSPFVPRENQFALAAGEQLTVPDLEVGVAIQPIDPPPGGTVADPEPLFRWEPVDGADSYRVTISDRSWGEAMITAAPKSTGPRLFRTAPTTVGVCRPFAKAGLSAPSSRSRPSRRSSMTGLEDSPQSMAAMLDDQIRSTIG